MNVWRGIGRKKEVRIGTIALPVSPHATLTPIEIPSACKYLPAEAASFGVTNALRELEAEPLRDDNAEWEKGRDCALGELTAEWEAEDAADSWPLPLPLPMPMPVLEAGAEGCRGRGRPSLAWARGEDPVWGVGAGYV